LLTLEQPQEILNHAQVMGIPVWNVAHQKDPTEISTVVGPFLTYESIQLPGTTMTAHINPGDFILIGQDDYAMVIDAINLGRNYQTIRRNKPVEISTQLRDNVTVTISGLRNPDDIDGILERMAKRVQ
jgi:hypothetical protein